MRVPRSPSQNVGSRAAGDEPIRASSARVVESFALLDWKPDAR